MHSKALIQHAKSLVGENPKFGPAFIPQPLRVPAGFEASNLVDQFNRLVFYISGCNRAQYTFNFRYNTDKDARDWDNFDFLYGSDDWITCVDKGFKKWLGKFDDFVIAESARLTEWVSENPQFVGTVPSPTLANTNMLPPGWGRALLDMNPALHRILGDVRDFVRRLLQQPNLCPEQFLANYVSTTQPSRANALGWPAGISLPIKDLYDEILGNIVVCLSPLRRNIGAIEYDFTDEYYDLPANTDLGLEKCIAEQMQDFVSIPGGDFAKWGAAHMKDWFAEYEATRFPGAAEAATTGAATTAAATGAWNPFTAYPNQLWATGYRTPLPSYGAFNGFGR